MSKAIQKEPEFRLTRKRLMAQMRTEKWELPSGVKLTVALIKKHIPKEGLCVCKVADLVEMWIDKKFLLVHCCGVPSRLIWETTEKIDRELYRRLLSFPGLPELLQEWEFCAAWRNRDIKEEFPPEERDRMRERALSCDEQLFRKLLPQLSKEHGGMSAAGEVLGKRMFEDLMGRIMKEGEGK